MTDWRGVGVVLIGADGGIFIRTGMSLSSWNGGTAIGSPGTANEARLLADVAAAAEAAVDMWRAGDSLSSTSTEASSIEATDEDSHTRAVELGRRGGRKGGLARARALTPALRSEIARTAAKARWKATHAASLPFVDVDR